MVELFEQDIRQNDRQSSKGNQLKWENAGVWYKADYTGYEGLSEYIISHLLLKSTLSKQEFVLYDIEEIRYREQRYTGAKSENFLREGWQLITLERLFKNMFGKSLYQSIFAIQGEEERYRFLVSQIERITGLRDFGTYLNKLFTIDAFFLNEDRHMHNIAVLMNGEGEFAYCPIFDNGAALLADTKMDYPMQGDVYTLMKEAQAKTICDDFDKQLDVSEMVSGEHIKFHFTRKDVSTLLEAVAEYSEEEKRRVETIIFMQMHKYPYLFQENSCEVEG